MINFNRLLGDWRAIERWQFNPDGTLLEAFPELRASASVSRAAAAAFFGSGTPTIEAVFAASEKGEPQAFALGLDVTLAGKAAAVGVTRRS